MTDQLDHDLRRLLAERAAAVTPDVARGEAAIATRLAAGDAGLADVVSLTTRSRRRPLTLVAAAVVLIATIGAAVALQDRDEAVVTSQPEAEEIGSIGFFTAEGSVEEVTQQYLADRLDVAVADARVTRNPREPGQSADLVGVAWELTSWNTRDGVSRTVVLRDLAGDRWEVVESYSDGASIDSMEIDGDQVVVHATGPGTLNLSVHAIDGRDTGVSSSSFCGTGAAIGGAPVTTALPSVTECDLELDVDLDLLPATVRLIVSGDDGRPRMLEERLLADAVEGTGSASGPTTTATATLPQPADDPTIGAPGDAAKDVAERVAREIFGEEYVTVAATDEGSLTLVTMEGEGGELVAEVAYDADLDRNRLVRIRPASGSGQIGLVNAAGSLVLEVPAGGTLTYGTLDLALVELMRGELIGGESAASAPIEGVADEAVAWIWARLETSDGRVLHWLDRP